MLTNFKHAVFLYGGMDGAAAHVYIQKYIPRKLECIFGTIFYTIVLPTSEQTGIRQRTTQRANKSNWMKECKETERAADGL